MCTTTINIFWWASFAIFASVQIQASRAAQGDSRPPANAPAPTVKYLDFGDVLDPISKRNITRNVTIGPTRPDPRQPEPPTPVPTSVPTTAPTPAPTPDPGPWVTKTIGHDQVKPFAQPVPVTISEKAGVKLKPQIQIMTGCVPYPAVNDIGETGGGLKTSGNPKGGCRDSGHGSQVYGRLAWPNAVWAIMYSWYFPKDSPLGHRHDWEHAIVFIDNPDVPERKILGCSVSPHSGYIKHNPCPWYIIDSTSLKVRYKHTWPKNHDLDVTGDTGKFEDLIMWDQMTEDVRRALNSVSFDSANTPMNDWNFAKKFEKAWPF